MKKFRLLLLAAAVALAAPVVAPIPAQAQIASGWVNDVQGDHTENPSLSTRIAVAWQDMKDWWSAHF